MKDYEIPDEDGEYLTINGMCDRCGRGFQKTYQNPKYSVLDIDENGELANEWKDYELMGTEMFYTE